MIFILKYAIQADRQDHFRKDGFNRHDVSHRPCAGYIIMVGVAQLVEPQVVALVVVGSSPITHPIKISDHCSTKTLQWSFYLQGP